MKRGIRMSSTAKISANRENARKSTGPTTERGKSKSRLNALKLGIYATTPVLPGEDEEAYQEIAKSNLEYFAPVGPVESVLVGQITTEQWRLERIQRAENALLLRAREGQIAKFLRSLTAKEMAHVTATYDDELRENLRQARHEEAAAAPMEALQWAALGVLSPPRKVPKEPDEDIKDGVDARLGRVLDPDNTLLDVVVPATEGAPQTKLVDERRMTMRAYLAYVSRLEELQAARRTVTLPARTQPATGAQKPTNAKRPARLSVLDAANQNHSDVVNS